MRLTRRTLLASLAAAWALPAAAALAGPPVPARLASGGRPLMQVVTAPDASMKVRALAASLADMLGRIAGASFVVATGDGSSGVAVGTAADFPGAPGAAGLASGDATHREDYAVSSDAGGVRLIGATEQGVSHAVWDVLYRLGYRQFFPGSVWQIVPSLPELSLALDLRQSPDYLARSIWYEYGPWDYAAQPYADWCAKNRAASGIALNTGHAYQSFIDANKAVFAAHPEYLGLVDGVRKSSKLCISNPDLRQLVVDTVLREIAKKPTLDSVSCEPSDGNGWCECPLCAAIGSITDRALTLTNQVAAAVSDRYPGKLVGMYAYNQHSPPPNISAHPAVVVSIATAFIQPGWTLDMLLAGWSAKASTLGIREYYSINAWARDRPADSRGGDIAYLGATIPAFRARGARFMSAESGDGWAPNGIGHYVAARMLWDVSEASRLDDLKEEFLRLAFGPAETPMAAFYAELDGSAPHPDPSGQIRRMFQEVDSARTIAGSSAVRARVDDLTLYARYVDLLDRYTFASGDDRQAAFEALIRHAYRMRTTMMVHTLALYRDLPGRDKKVKVPAGAEWDVQEGKNPWKSSAPFTDAELADFIAEGIARHPA